MSANAERPRSFQSGAPVVRRLWAFARREPLIHFAALAWPRWSHAVPAYAIGTLAMVWFIDRARLIVLI